jgi:hypothetical protein
MDDEPTINWEKKLDKDENMKVEPWQCRERTLETSRKNVGSFENERWELREKNVGSFQKERWELREKNVENFVSLPGRTSAHCKTAVCRASSASSSFFACVLLRLVVVLSLSLSRRCFST